MVGIGKCMQAEGVAVKARAEGHQAQGVEHQHARRAGVPRRQQGAA